MSDANLKTRCSRCLGTGIDRDGEVPVPCTPCAGTGYVSKDKIDTTEITEKNEDIDAEVESVEAKVGLLQTCLDQVAEVVKENNEYIKKIYEIISKA